jgi:hypothetical protein
MADLDQLKGLIKPNLRRYLESRGIKIEDSGHFLCPNPNHKDAKTKSAHLVPDSQDTYWRCFGCLPTDEPVLSDDGRVIPAGGVTTLDRLVNAHGGRTQVTHVHKHLAGEPVVELTHGAGALKATADHDMLAVFDLVTERGRIRTNYMAPT